MDTEITYKYRDEINSEIKSGHITLDKSIFKLYVQSYGCKIEDSVLTSFPRRLWNCKLFWEGDIDCKRFLNDLKEFWTHSNAGFAEQYEEKFKLLYELLMHKELIKIIFECY